MRHPINRARLVVAGRRVLPFLAFLVIALTVASTAQANARFVYETCDPTLPAGNPPTIIFHNPSGAIYESFQTCAEPGGSIGVAQKSGVALPSTRAWMEVFIQPTPEGWIESLTMTASASEFHGNFGGVDEEHWPVAGSGDNPRYFLLRSQPVEGPSAPWGDGAIFDIELECGFSDCEPGAYDDAHFISALEVDQTPPTITSVEGPLVAGDVLRGHQGLRAEASDVGGGVRSLELKVNGIAMPGTVVGPCSVVHVENSSYRGLASTSPSPCPSSLSGVWDVDTSSSPFRSGMNTVQLCASDFATSGLPNTSCSNPKTVEVNNSCTESPVAGGADLSAGFGRNGAPELTVKFGSGTEIKGDLTDQAGNPISGATICMQSQIAGSTAAGQTVATATTDGGGNFGLDVGPGANRELLIGYRHDSFQIAKKLALGTRAHPTLVLNKHKVVGGHRIELTGKLPGPDPGGHVLVLQGSSAHGDSWETFKRVTTGPYGNFRTTYRFTKPSKKTTFRVRVVVPAQTGYEYEPGTSRPARVRVRR